MSGERSRADRFGARFTKRDASRYWHELTTGVGREGVRALLSFVGCTLVTAIGVAAVWSTWTSTDGTRVFEWLPFEVRLPAVWIVYLLAVGVTGWFLSNQVSKRSVRAFVGVSVVIGCLLLITVGRNVRIEESATTARNDARQLAEILPPLSGVVGEDSAQRWLVRRLCVLGHDSEDVCRFRVLATGFDDREGLDAVPLNRDLREVELSCLPGWTLAAFGEWASGASLDREVVALTALARCELNAFDPGSDTGEELAMEEAGSLGAVPQEAASSANGNGTSEEGAGGASGQGGSEQDDEARAAEVREAVEQEAETQAAVDARAAVAEALRVQRSEANLFQTIAAGADGVLSAVSGPADFAEFRFSGATWLVILGLSLLWYRNLEIRAGTGQLGPVDIQFEDASESTVLAEQGERSSATTDDALLAGQAIFKQAVVQNVPEPGTVPGAYALAPVGDLVASTVTSHGRLIDGITDALQTLLATRSGFTVQYAAHWESDVTRGPDAKPSSVVFVKIRDTRTGGQMASMRFAADHVEEASQIAGYWVAGWIIWRSRSVPSWARWSENDARAFHSLQWRQGDDLQMQTRTSVDPSTIDPTATNALVLAQRAYAYQISNDGGGPYLFNALEDFARAVHRQPRYPVARYRRAAALSALMNEGVQLTDVFKPRTGELSLPSRSRLRHLFGDLIGYEGRTSDRVEGADEIDQTDDGLDDLDRWIQLIHEGGPDNPKGTFPPEMRAAMMDVVARWIDEARAGILAGRVARVRPSERRFWRDFAGTGVKDDWMHLVDTSECILGVRAASLPTCSVARCVPTDELIERAKDPESHWQISYNLACYYSLAAAAAAVERDDESRKDDVRQSFAWLERCLDRRFSGQLVREWAERDPDLTAARSDADEWKRWLRRVPRLPVVFRLGDENARIRELQHRLNVLDHEHPIDEDGVYGLETVEAIRRFQRSRGLRIDGTLDAITRAQLETQYEEAIHGSTTGEPRRPPAPDPARRLVAAIKDGSAGRDPLPPPPDDGSSVGHALPPPPPVMSNQRH